MTVRTSATSRRRVDDAALAAAATLVAVAFALSDARALAASGAALTSWPGRSSLALFAVGLGRTVGGRAGGWSGRDASASSTSFGAVLNVPWLALGTVYLLAGRAGR